MHRCRGYPPGLKDRDAQRSGMPSGVEGPGCGRVAAARGSLDFTIYPDTWIRDLPLLDLGPGAYIANRATLGTNMALSNGTSLVDRITIGAGTTVGHLAVLAPGVEVGEGAELGATVVIGIGVHIGAGANIQPCAGINHVARIGEGATVGSAAYVGAAAVVAPSVRSIAGRVAATSACWTTRSRNGSA